MNLPALFLSLCGAAAMVPLLPRESRTPTDISPEWPSEFGGARLHQVPLSDAETAFHKDFPGAAGRFTDGRSEFIFRWVTKATRKLHASADCFRGSGYAIYPEGLFIDAGGKRWNHFRAARGLTTVRVRERIYSVREAHEWTDVSAWYWAGLLRQSGGPWLAVTVVEPI